MKIQIFRRRNWRGKWRFYFRIVAANGETVAHSEAYHNRHDATATAVSIQPQITVVEEADR